MTGVEQRFENSYYVIDPEEAARIGLPAVPWYAMPATGDRQQYTSITSYPEAFNITGRAAAAEAVPEVEVEWALEVTFTIEGTPYEWLRRPST